MNNTFRCQHCQEPLVGRSDKKFCDDACRNAYNNRKSGESAHIFRPLISRLKANYRALQKIQARSTVASLRELELLGFQPQYCTQSFQDPSGTTLYCFNIGYRITPDQQLQIVHPQH